MAAVRPRRLSGFRRAFCTPWRERRVRERGKAEMSGEVSGEADGLQHARGHAVVAVAEHGGLLDVDCVALVALEPGVPRSRRDRSLHAVAQVVTQLGDLRRATHRT